MATWPSTLPQSLNVDGYMTSSQDGRVRTSMDAGPDFVRRRFSAVTVSHAGTMILTTAQVATLETFFNTTLSGGSLSFDWHPLGRHQDSPQVVLDLRFMSPPSYRALGNDRWQVDVALEALP